MKKLQQTFISSVQSGDLEAVKKALGTDATLSESITEKGISVLLLAAYMRNQPMVDLLSAHRKNFTIFEAVATGQKKIFYQQINAQPELLNTFSSDGFTLIGLACFFGKKGIVEILLEKGADVNISSNNDFKVAPLHSAAAARQLEIAILLLKNGATVNALQQRGVTPLHSAAHLGDVEMVKLLLEHGADKNLRTKMGKAAIDFAKEGNFEEVVDLLNE